MGRIFAVRDGQLRIVIGHGQLALQSPAMWRASVIPVSISAAATNQCLWPLRLDPMDRSSA